MDFKSLQLHANEPQSPFAAFNLLALEQVPVYASLPIPPNQQEISHKNFQRQFIPLYTLSNSTDRFIPQRKDQNFEVSRYNLMHRDYENDHNSERYFNVLHQ
ncbi:hypothetical protein PV326_000834, partial [Microctonus aethiopoides]